MSFIAGDGFSTGRNPKDLSKGRESVKQEKTELSTHQFASLFDSLP